MAEFISETKTILYPIEEVYSALSDLNNLEKAVKKLPQDKVTDITIEQDKASFSISPLGRINLFIENKEPFTIIKFGISGIPVKAALIIRLAKEESTTKMDISLEANLNPILKGMLSKPIQEGIDKMADTLAVLPYDEI